MKPNEGARAARLIKQLYVEQRHRRRRHLAPHETLQIAYDFGQGVRNAIEKAEPAVGPRRAQCALAAASTPGNLFYAVEIDAVIAVNVLLREGGWSNDLPLEKKIEVSTPILRELIAECPAILTDVQDVPDYLQHFTDVSKMERWYFRRPPLRNVALPGRPEQAQFMRAYVKAWHEAEEARKLTTPRPDRRQRRARADHAHMRAG